jgi:MFS family permease
MSLLHHFRETFRSLRWRNYRLYYLGQLFSLAGTWMQGLALSWLVYKLTHSAEMLGLVSFCGMAPVLLFGIFGGYLVDRINRRKLLIITQTLSMLQASLLAFLTLTGQIEIWQIFVLATLLGAINAVDMPCRQSYVVDLVGKQDVVNAVGLSASMYHGSRVMGPAIAGLLVGWIGEGPCFVINALSFLSLLAALLAIKPSEMRVEKREKPHAEQFFDAFHFARQNSSVRNVLALSAFSCFFGMQYTTLLPLVVGEVLHREVASLGMLTATAGVGALIAALSIARWGSKKILLPGVGVANLTAGLALIIFSQTNNLVLSGIVILVMGFCNTTAGAGTNSLLQITVPDNLRGRMMSIYTTTAVGFMSLGSLFAGFMAHQWGAPLTLLLAGLICAIAASVYLILTIKDNQSLAVQAKSVLDCYHGNKISDEVQAERVQSERVQNEYSVR